MKKQNLVILLLIPFVIALLGVVTINVTFNLIDNDITGISWNYQTTEGFKVGNRYLLEATGISDSKYPLSLGNELTWSVKNKNDEDSSTLAHIEEDNGAYYLVADNEGEVIITVSNKKGNIFKSMNGILYKNGVIILNPVIKDSQNNISPNIYYGEYDLKNNTKTKASFAYTLTYAPDTLKNDIYIKDISSNISFSLDDLTFEVLGAGSAYLTLGTKDASAANDTTLSFEIVKDGINVYTYDDLLYCTNKSENGEIAVLRKSFVSLDTYNSTSDNNVELFGTYNEKTKTYNFINEVYQFDTTFNSEYIDQWNAFAATTPSYTSVDKTIYAGLHIQKDFYGNGYSLNFHNLTYPYLETQVGDNVIPTLGSDNLFRGPKPFYSLGNPNQTPLITAYGQDNSGIYIEGDNITLNDVNVTNADFGNILSNLDYVGNVVDILGNNITIKNSRLQNGKNIIRSFSSNNVNIENTMLSNSRNFLITTGSNEYCKLNKNQTRIFKDDNGNYYSSTIDNFFAANNKGDELLTNYLSGSFTSKEGMLEALNYIDDAFNNVSNLESNYTYKGSMNIKDCFFYQSGVSCIALETYFNGPYLATKSPSLIGSLFSSISYNDSPLVPLEPDNVSGISYPVSVNIEGNTLFYDYKKVSSLDVSGLIDENISTFASDVAGQLGIGDVSRDITIEDIFPIKSLLTNVARSSSCIYDVTSGEDTLSYFNIPIAYYGGGLNLSTVTYNGYNYEDSLAKELLVNLLENYLDLASSSSSSSMMSYMKTIMLKAVTVVIGFKPFRFTLVKNNSTLFNLTYNKAPNVSTLITNAKGE